MTTPEVCWDYSFPRDNPGGDYVVVLVEGIVRAAPRWPMLSPTRVRITSGSLSSVRVIFFGLVFMGLRC